MIVLKVGWNVGKKGGRENGQKVIVKVYENNYEDLKLSIIDEDEEEEKEMKIFLVGILIRCVYFFVVRMDSCKDLKLSFVFLF